MLNRKGMSFRCTGKTLKETRCKRKTSNESRRCLYHAIPKDVCSICCDNIEPNEMRETRCGHQYHRGCIRQWFGTQNTTCPMCRYQLKASKAKTQYQVSFNGNIAAYVHIENEFINDNTFTEIFMNLLQNGYIEPVTNESSDNELLFTPI